MVRTIDRQAEKNWPPLRPLKGEGFKVTASLLEATFLIPQTSSQTSYRLISNG